MRACYINQKIGVGRAMKIGKEGIVGAIAALERWKELDHRALHAAGVREARGDPTRDPGAPWHLRKRDPDPSGNPITQLKVVTGAHESADDLARALLLGDPPIAIRSHDTDPGYLEIDPCNLLPGDVEAIVARFRGVLGGRRDVPSGTTEPTSAGPRRARYLESGLPAVELAAVPWGNRRSPADRVDAALLRWPDGPDDG